MSTDKQLIDELLDLTKFLEEEYVFTGTDAFPPFLEATARKSYWYIYSLKELASDENNGDAIIDLSRSLLESLIVVMYVEEFGKEKKAKKFLMYSPIEVWNDTQYGIKTVPNLPPKVLEQRREEYEVVKEAYLRPTKLQIAEKEAKKAVKAVQKVGVYLTEEQKRQFLEIMTKGKSNEEIVNKSWDGTDLETMIQELDKKAKFPGLLRDSIEEIYTLGNRENHLSPNDVALRLEPKARTKRNRNHNRRIGLFQSLLSYVMIIKELAALRNDADLKDKIEVLNEKLLKSAEEETKNKKLAKLVIVIGLPGSGKSYYFDNLVSKGETTREYICDDFHGDANNNPPRVVDSKHWFKLLSNLEQGKECYISDVEFCDKSRLQELIDIVKIYIPEISIESRYFENDPDNCEKNAIARGKIKETNVPIEIATIKRLTKIYKVPEDVTPMHVYKN
jgi:hypothetical protein